MIVSWQKVTKQGLVEAKGRLAVGPVPGLIVPLLYIYQGEWPAELDAQFEPLFLEAFEARDPYPYYLP